MRRGASLANTSRIQRGASLVEVLFVIALLGILSILAIHSALEYKRRAEAASVVADFQVFRDAVREHYSATGVWPGESTRSQEPSELTELLEGQIRWTRPELGIEYDWENWACTKGSFTKPRTGVAYGFSVVIPTRRERFERIFDDIVELYEGRVVRVGPGRLTFVIEPISPVPGSR